MTFWIRRNLRGSVVYARADAAGRLAAGPDGRVDIMYKPVPGAKLYRAAARNLSPTGEPGDDTPRALDVAVADADADAGARGGRGSPRTGRASGAGRSERGRASERERNTDRSAAGASGAGKPAPAVAADAVVIYTDGACTGNPGPAGLGVVILDRGQRRELSEYLGVGTNNIAELTAILRALEAVGEAARERPVVVHSDSSYALGLLTRGWKAKANPELVARLRAVAAAFPRLRFVKVKGHAGVPENERADELARRAVERRGR